MSSIRTNRPTAARGWSRDDHEALSRTWEDALDTDAELTFEVAADVDAQVALRFRAGGVALLACDAIAVTEQPAKLRKARPRSWQSSFTMWSDDTEVTVARLLTLLGLDALAPLQKKKTAGKTWTLASLEEAPRALYG